MRLSLPVAYAAQRLKRNACSAGNRWRYCRKVPLKHFRRSAGSRAGLASSNEYIILNIESSREH
jgi:hypothetical protein